MSSDRDKVEGLDLFLGDMASTQEKRGALPDTSRNATMAAELFTEMDNNGSFLESGPAEIQQAEPDLDRTVYDLKREADGEDLVRPIDPIHQRVLKRYRFLMTQKESGPLGQPSWAKRAEKVQSFFVINRGQRGYRDAMRRYSYELIKLIDESDRYFGSWKLDFLPEDLCAPTIM